MVSLRPLRKENIEENKVKGIPQSLGKFSCFCYVQGYLATSLGLVIPVHTQGNECQTSQHSHAVCPVYGPRAGLGLCYSTKLAGDSPWSTCCLLGLSHGFLSPTLAKVPLTFAFNKRKLGMFPQNRLINILSKIAC